MSHSVAVQPQGRKPSVWGKMFDGLKINSKNVKRNEEVETRPHENVGSIDMSKSSAVDKTTSTIHRRNNSTATKASVAAVSIQSSTSRAGSVASISSRRSSRKWWRSSNPEDELPPVPTIDLKYTEVSPMSQAASRKNSYVPRNAAGSFLRTTTPAPKSTQDDLDEVARRLSASGAAASINPLQVKAIESRKDSHVQPEMYGMSSMSGICDILEVEEPVIEKNSVRSASPHSQGAARQDSAKGSPELTVIKNANQRDPSLHELCA
ncbi:hypothetical protein AAFC00_006241 [Neodothiora populina]|uniref:Uncharacterized protein n=1 Tax=Neodothiora populina TaxID=2781224 RepID=A0ABR3P4I6_9PEZI